MNLILAVVVILAGGLGAVLRLLIGTWIGILPWGILAANTVASLVAGLAMEWAGSSGLNQTIAPGSLHHDSRWHGGP